MTLLPRGPGWAWLTLRSRGTLLPVGPGGTAFALPPGLTSRAGIPWRPVRTRLPSVPILPGRPFSARRTRRSTLTDSTRGAVLTVSTWKPLGTRGTLRPRLPLGSGFALLSRSAGQSLFAVLPWRAFGPSAARQAGVALRTEFSGDPRRPARPFRSGLPSRSSCSIRPRKPGWPGGALRAWRTSRPLGAGRPRSLQDDSVRFGADRLLDGFLQLQDHALVGLKDTRLLLQHGNAGLSLDNLFELHCQGVVYLGRLPRLWVRLHELVQHSDLLLDVADDALERDGHRGDALSLTYQCDVRGRILPGRPGVPWQTSPVLAGLA